MISRNVLRKLLVLVFIGGVVSLPTPSLAQKDQASGLTLDQVQAAYGIDQLMKAGMDGSGQTVAVIMQGGFKPADLKTFADKYKLPAPNITPMLVGGNSGATDSGSAEWSMDVEIVDAMAPKATILAFEGPSLFGESPAKEKTSGVLNAILTDGRASTISLSYDGCELTTSDAQAQGLLDLTKRVHDAGMTLFHGAGDTGAYWCAKDPSSPDADKLSVGVMAGLPYATILGGTTLTVTNGQYGSETVWVNLTKKTGTGGGLSARWPLPDYQKPFLLTSANPNQMRQVPDAAADADPSMSFPIYCTASEATACKGWHNSGGDSATGPLWAGATALVNQYLAAHLADLKGGPYRLYGPDDLYALATAYADGKVAKPPFHDVTEGNNLYYKASQGYDLTTGLGTPDFYNIAVDLEQLYRTQAISVPAGVSAAN